METTHSPFLACHYLMSLFKNGARNGLQDELLIMARSGGLLKKVDNAMVMDGDVLLLIILLEHAFRSFVL